MILSASLRLNSKCSKFQLTARTLGAIGATLPVELQHALVLQVGHQAGYLLSTQKRPYKCFAELQAKKLCRFVCIMISIYPDDYPLWSKHIAANTSHRAVL